MATETLLDAAGEKRWPRAGEHGDEDGREILVERVTRSLEGNPNIVYTYTDEG